MPNQNQIKIDTELQKQYDDQMLIAGFNLKVIYEGNEIRYYKDLKDYENHCNSKSELRTKHKAIQIINLEL